MPLVLLLLNYVADKWRRGGVHRAARWGVGPNEGVATKARPLRSAATSVHVVAAGAMLEATCAITTTLMRAFRDAMRPECSRFRDRRVWGEKACVTVCSVRFLVNKVFKLS